MVMRSDPREHGRDVFSQADLSKEISSRKELYSQYHLAEAKRVEPKRRLLCIIHHLIRPFHGISHPAPKPKHTFEHHPHAIPRKRHIHILHPHPKLSSKAFAAQYLLHCPPPTHPLNITHNPTLTPTRTPVQRRRPPGTIPRTSKSESTGCTQTTRFPNARRFLPAHSS